MLNTEYPELRCKLSLEAELKMFSLLPAMCSAIENSTVNVSTCVEILQSMVPERVYSVAAPLTWNALPNYVRQSDSLAIFKSRLKTALFTTAFDS